MLATEYDKMTKALCHSIQNGHGAVFTNYEAQNRSTYFGGVTVLFRQVPLPNGDGMNLWAKFHACEEEIPGDPPKYRPQVRWKEKVHIGGKDVYKALVFRINDGNFMQTMEEAMLKYAASGETSELHFRPYFKRMFSKPIWKGLEGRHITMAYPEGNTDVYLAVRHLAPAEEPTKEKTKI